jgi:molybdate transport system substrate-binding protein
MRRSPAAHGQPCATARRHVPTAVLLLGGVLALSACTGVPRGTAVYSAGGTSTAGPTTLAGTLRVDAAASLKGAFDELTRQFAAEHPGVSVASPVYDGSSTLVMQLGQGAVADVVALADTRTMATAAAAGLIDAGPPVFATNTLEIAVAPGNPRHITSLADLARPGLQVVLCAPQVPCGAAAATALAAAGVTVRAASQEQNVTAVVTKVGAGEADAGLVYATDVRASGGQVDGLRFPEAKDAVNSYPIAVLRDAPSPAVARAFVDLVLSPQGQGVLASYGFGAP